jgi:hypothetical protein
VKVQGERGPGKGEARRTGGVRRDRERVARGPPQQPPSRFLIPRAVAVSPNPASFRQTLIRVMTVQVVTLVILWLLQRRYGG